MTDVVDLTETTIVMTEIEVMEETVIVLEAAETMIETIKVVDMVEVVIGIVTMREMEIDKEDTIEAQEIRDQEGDLEELMMAQGNQLLKILQTMTHFRRLVSYTTNEKSMWIE